MNVHPSTILRRSYVSTEVNSTPGYHYLALSALYVVTLVSLDLLPFTVSFRLHTLVFTETKHKHGIVPFAKFVHMIIW